MHSQTPQNFEGIRPFWEVWSYYDSTLEEHKVDELCILVDNLAATDENDLETLGACLKEKLLVSRKCCILTSLNTVNGPHALTLAFHVKEDGNADMILMDSSGNKCPESFLPKLTLLLEHAGLRGKTVFTTGVPRQQFPDQPNTCALWAVKNAIDYLSTGTIAAPATVEDASTLIEE